jgi:serine/threonine protein kinase
MDFCNEGDLGG